ncbi:MAG: hypothetical protein EA367_15035 [Leptolyngbya sp. DLM2.Bin15]|nr:MAG: hypothetical protein EA367_15035 [Leptolyngbya sp. DLM2.Bin15]
MPSLPQGVNVFTNDLEAIAHLDYNNGRTPYIVIASFLWIDHLQSFPQGDPNRTTYGLMVHTPAVKYVYSNS